MQEGGVFQNLWRWVRDAGYRAYRSDLRAYRAAHGQDTPEGFTGLLPGDMIWDIGAETGDWADAMTARYAVAVHVFPNSSENASRLSQKFKGRSDVVVHDFGLGSASDQFLRDVGDVFETLGRPRVALAKVHTHGGEYDLLPALVERGLIAQVDRITVKFHKLSEGDRARRDAIRSRMAQTHDCVWSYPFIWEEWHRQGLGV